MTSARVLGVVCAVVVAFAALAAGNSTDEKWNGNIAWVAGSWDDAVAEATASQKPIFLVVHRSWCGACKRTSAAFKASKEIEELSKSFTMVQFDQDSDEEGAGAAKFRPDGGYFPRFLFASPAGEVQPEHKNAGGNPKYGYFYSDAASIVRSMKAVLAASPASGHEEL